MGKKSHTGIRARKKQILAQDQGHVLNEINGFIQNNVNNVPGAPMFVERPFRSPDVMMPLCTLTHHKLLQINDSPQGSGGSHSRLYRLGWEDGNSIDRMYLSMRFPPLNPNTSLGQKSVHYTWGVGYAAWEWVDVKNGTVDIVPRVTSDCMEIWTDIQAKPGKEVRDMAFKVDRATPARLESLSRKGIDLYVPLDFWFTRDSVGLLVTEKPDQIIRFGFRDLTELVVVYGEDGTCQKITKSSMPLVPDADGQGGFHPLSWGDVEVSVIARTRNTSPSPPDNVTCPGFWAVNLDNPHRLLPCKTVQPGTRRTVVQHLELPSVRVQSMIWFVRGLEDFYNGFFHLSPEPFHAFQSRLLNSPVQFNGTTGYGTRIPGNRFDHRLAPHDMSSDEGSSSLKVSLDVTYNKLHRVQPGLSSDYFRHVSTFDEPDCYRSTREGVYYYPFAGGGFYTDGGGTAGAYFPGLNDVKLEFNLTGDQHDLWHVLSVEVWFRCPMLFRQSYAEGCVPI